MVGTIYFILVLNPVYTVRSKSQIYSSEGSVQILSGSTESRVRESRDRGVKAGFAQRGGAEKTPNKSSLRRIALK